MKLLSPVVLACFIFTPISRRSHQEAAFVTEREKIKKKRKNTRPLPCTAIFAYKKGFSISMRGYSENSNGTDTMEKRLGDDAPGRTSTARQRTSPETV